MKHKKQYGCDVLISDANKISKYALDKLALKILDSIELN